MVKKQPLKQVRDSIVACKKCSLYKTRKFPVIGMGNHNADIMLVGSMPTSDEDNTGIPLVGSEGKIVNDILTSVGIKDNIYACNVLKCITPGSIEPKVEEFYACVGYLTHQIEIISPKVICTMGIDATKIVLEHLSIPVDKPMALLHGRIFAPDTTFQTGSKNMGEEALANIKVIPTYHPVTAKYVPEHKQFIEDDFKIIKEYLLLSV